MASKVLFTAPTVSRDQSAGIGCRYLKYDNIQIQGAVLAGERCDRDTPRLGQETLQVPVIDHWWQTEQDGRLPPTVWASGSSHQARLSPVCGPGCDVRVLDENAGNEEAPGEIGRIMIKLPMPPAACPPCGRMTTDMSNLI